MSDLCDALIFDTVCILFRAIVNVSNMSEPIMENNAENSQTEDIEMDDREWDIGMELAL